MLCGRDGPVRNNPPSAAAYRGRWCRNRDQRALGRDTAAAREKGAAGRVAGCISMNPEGYIIINDALAHSIGRLDEAFDALSRHEVGDLAHDVISSICVKEYGLILDQLRRLLQETVRARMGTDSHADSPAFRDIFSQAAQLGIIADESRDRWIEYEDSRGAPEYNDGEKVAGTILNLLPRFLADARDLKRAIEASDD